MATFLFEPIYSLFSFLVSFLGGNGKTKILQGSLVFPALPKPQSLGNLKKPIAVTLQIQEPKPAFLLCSKLSISCARPLEDKGIAKLESRC